VPCTGAILRVNAAGGDVELVAWGLRNPFGLAFDGRGVLYTTDNGADERGSRPIFGAADVLWKIEPGAWYGWPDFSEGRAVDHNRYAPPGGETPHRLLAKHPSTPPKPAAYLAVHASANGLDFSTNPVFGYEGQAFIAIFGDMAPKVGKVMSPVGFKVVRVDVASGIVRDFAVNRSEKQGPASLLGKSGLERPVAVRFDSEKTSLYVVDFGVLAVSEGGITASEGTGVVWRIHRTGTP
jgi:glucose/arabinose dehydrogenase